MFKAVITQNHNSIYPSIKASSDGDALKLSIRYILGKRKLESPSYNPTKIASVYFNAIAVCKILNEISTSGKPIALGTNLSESLC